MLLLQHRQWLVWDLALSGVSAPIVWISPVFNAAVFALLSIFLWAGLRNFCRISSLTIVTFVLTLITVFDLLALIGRIRHVAMVILAAGVATIGIRHFQQHLSWVIHRWRKSVRVLAAITIALLVIIEAGGRIWEYRQEQRLPVAREGVPNIVVLVIDTLRSDHLSTYGYNRPTSPNITRIAEQGVLFQNAFATSSWTVPSHASLLTGRYPHEHGMESGLDPLDKRFPTLAEALRDQGYRTGAFSANTLFFCKRLAFDRGFIHFDDYFKSIADMASRTMLGREFNRLVRTRVGLIDAPARRHASEINLEALKWIDKGRSRPFMVFLNYFDNHQPYLPPARYRAKFQENSTVRAGAANSLAFRDSDGLGPEEIRAETAAYDAAISYVDDEVGRLFIELQHRGFDKNTLFIITSDHGESLGEHGLFGHRQALYRDEIQVPLIFWWPGHVPSGSQISIPVSNANLPSTILDLIGDHNQQLFPGGSLARLWTGSVPAQWPAPLSELSRLPSGSPKKLTYHGWMKCMVTSDWHYILHQKYGPQLYRWKDDSSEANDLAAGEQRIVREFGARLQSNVPGISVPAVPQQSASR